MRIDRLELFRVASPLPAPLHVAAQPGVGQTHNELTFVRMTTDEGVVGESAGMTVGRFHAGLGDALGHFILGRDPLDIDGFGSVLDAGEALGIRLAWLEPALWDITGKVEGEPVYRLLGGTRTRIKAYASTSELRPPDERAENLLRLKEMGFQGVKLRAHHHDWHDDVAVIERARDAVGADLKLMVDANQGFHFSLRPGAPPKWDVDTAAAFAQAIEPCDMTWLEEPLDRNDYAGLAELRQRTSIPLAGGELNWRFNEYGLLVEKQCLDILQADAMFFGGIAGCRKVAALAEARGLTFAAHTWNNGFALLANLHLMAASPNCEWCEFPYEPPGWTLEGRDALLAEPTGVDRDGYVHLPQGPGLGIVIDEEKLSRFGERFYDGRA